MTKTFYHKFSLILFLCSILGYATMVCLSGGNLLQLMLYGLAFCFCIVFSGYWILEKWGIRLSFFKGIGSAFVAGVFVCYLSFIITSLFHFPKGCLIVPFILGSIWLYKKKDTLSFKFSINNQAAFLLLIAGFLLALYTLCVLLPFARADKLGNFYYHQDMLWSVGNAASVYNGFPLADMRFSASTLNYHYLNDVTAGILGMGVGIPAYESLCFYYYPWVLLCLVTALYFLANNFCGTFLASLAPLLVLLCYGIRSDIPYHYLSNINGQGGATLALCGGIVLLTYYGASLQHKKVFSVLKILCVSLVTGFTISMFKSTIGALFILAVFAACIVGYFTKKATFNHLLFALGMGGGFLTAYGLIFSNAVNNLVFNGFASLPTLPKTLWISAPMGILVYICALVYSLRHFSKLSFLTLVCNAMFVGGSLAYVLYYHYSASQIYFLIIGMVMMWFCALSFLQNLMDKNKKIFSLLMVVFILGCVPSVFGLVNQHGRSGVQGLLRIAQLRAFDYQESYITKEDYDAMVWLRENTPQESIFATNRNNKSFQEGEGTFHYYSAVSQRRAYLESYRYCMDYSGMYPEVRRRLEQVSDNIFQHYTETQAFETARQEGIDYLVVFSPLNQVQWEASPAFENDSVVIYAV